MKITFFSNHCPQCRVLESMLKQKGLQYEEVNDVDLMISKGFTSMPILEVNDKVMTFKNALDWLKTI